MSYLLFVDESGQDHVHSPYEVLAGAAIQDIHIWRLVCDVQASEEDIFGLRISAGAKELKARELLKKKTFRLARQMDPIPPSKRSGLARAALLDGAAATREQLTALAQAKIEFTNQVLRLCRSYGVRFFASVVSPDAPQPSTSFLRKDYAYLFERFFYFLNDQPEHERGLVVFDELEKSRAYILVNQMSEYFQRTENGRTRVARIVPEPLFVHSDLTTGVQIADLAAYVIAWNVRFQLMRKRKRIELDGQGQALLDMRHRATIANEGQEDFHVWSFAYIGDLRPRGERERELLSLIKAEKGKGNDG